MPKIEKKQKNNENTEPVSFHHKSNFSSKTLILNKPFADSELVRPLCLRFVPKIEKKQKNKEDILTEKWEQNFLKKRSIKRFEKSFQVHPLTGCFMTENALNQHWKPILGALNRRKILFPFLAMNDREFCPKNECFFRENERNGYNRVKFSKLLAIKVWCVHSTRIQLREKGLQAHWLQIIF